MPRVDNSHYVVAAARRRAAATHKRAVSTLRRMDKAGQPITFDAVAREAGVSRSWLYNQPDLRTEVERLRARRHPPTPHAPVPTGNAPPTPPCCGGWRPLPSASSSWRPKTGSSARRSPTRSVNSGPTPFIGDRRDTPTTKSAASHRPLLTMRRKHRPQHITAGQSHAPCHQLQITSGLFAANCAWLGCAVIAHNLLRAAGDHRRRRPRRRARRHPAPGPGHRARPLRRPGPQADAAPARALAMADRVENPVGQHHRLQSREPTSRMNATSPAHPPSQARPRRHAWKAGAGQRITHAHTIPNRPNRAESAPRRHEITDPRERNPKWRDDESRLGHNGSRRRAVTAWTRRRP